MPFKDAIKVGGRMSKRFEAMSEPLPQPKENTSPFFTRPLEDAANRYIDAHAEVVSRREEKRVRHAWQWAQWKHSND